MTYKKVRLIVEINWFCIVIVMQIAFIGISQSFAVPLDSQNESKNLTVDNNQSNIVKSSYVALSQKSITLNNKENLTLNQEEQNASQIYIYPPKTFTTPEDKRTQEEWGGNCTVAYWDRCKVIKTWFGYYVDKNDPTETVQHKELDCVLEPKYCMKNGWTVNRCHILCMSQCNKEMQYKFDKYVSHEEECKAHGHG